MDRGDLRKLLQARRPAPLFWREGRNRAPLRTAVDRGQRNSAEHHSGGPDYVRSANVDAPSAHVQYPQHGVGTVNIPVPVLFVWLHWLVQWGRAVLDVLA